MRNRTQRRAAEREALKALRQSQRESSGQPPVMDEAAIAAKRQRLAEILNALQSKDPEIIRKGFPERTISMNTNESNNINNSARNATKHGCCSESILIMKGENPADFKALETTWFKAYNPKDAAETEMVHQIVESKWYEKRCLRKLAEMETHLMDSGSPFEWTEDQQKTLARFQRYATARTNAVIKAIKALEDYRKNRTNEVQKTEKHEIKKQQAKRKDEKEMTIEECILELEQEGERRRQAKNL
jgi:hypothetical protein